VVNQILPAVPFCASPVQAYFWRDAKSGAEVDLVLVDSEDRAVAVEVKASTSVSLGDISGITAFAARRQMVAGYVVFGGDRCVHLADNVWGIPLGRFF